MIVFKRRQVRPLLRDADRRFWVLARRCFAQWRNTLIIVKPETVIRWQRKGWRAYWRWRSTRSRGPARKKISPETRALIRRMARENPLWGQRRIQAELVRLGIAVCARTVAKYMRSPYDGTPSPGWRQFLAGHTDEIWACDLFTVQTLWFRTLYVFFVIHHGARELVHARVTAHPNSQWLAQQMVEACGLTTELPRSLIHDNNGSFGALFDRTEAWVREHHAHGPRLGREDQAPKLPPNRSSVGCTMCINGLPSRADRDFAPCNHLGGLLTCK